MKLYRSSIFQELSDAFHNDSLAPSLLFQGPKYSGRLSLALDLANEMGIKDIIFFPSRALGLELDAAYNMLNEKYSKRMLSFFISRVRRIIMQYHPSLQKEGFETAKEKLFTTAADISLMLSDLEGLDIDERSSVLELAEKIYSQAGKSDLQSKGKKKGTISVDEVRAIQNYLVGSAGRTMVIIENIEDAQEASRNALLKILEEPYDGLYFVLISSQGQRILTTILSRLRKYSFTPLNKNDLDDYLKSEFLAEKDYSSYEDFLFEMSAKESDRALIMDAAKKIASSFISRNMLGLDEEDECFKALDIYPSYFISLIIKEVRESFISGDVSAKRSYSIIKRLDSAMVSNGVYNQNIKSTLDLALREECFVH